MNRLLLSLLLMGNINAEYGRIGVRLNSRGVVAHVYDISPAANAGIQVGDVIISADGVKGDKRVDGIANQEVTIVFKHNNEIREITIMRVSPRDIADIEDYGNKNI